MLPDKFRLKKKVDWEEKRKGYSEEFKKREMVKNERKRNFGGPGVRIWLWYCWDFGSIPVWELRSHKSHSSPGSPCPVVDLIKEE